MVGHGISASGIIEPLGRYSSPLTLGLIFAMPFSPPDYPFLSELRPCAGFHTVAVSTWHISGPHRTYRSNPDLVSGVKALRARIVAIFSRKTTKLAR